MATLTLTLPAAVSLALRRFAAEQDLSREDAAVAVLKDWLAGHGFLEADVLDEESEVDGNA